MFYYRNIQPFLCQLLFILLLAAYVFSQILKEIVI